MDTEPALNRELLLGAALSGVPSHTLEACLGSYTKEQLLDLASDHEVDLPLSARKKQFVDSLSGRIVDRFPKMLPYLPGVPQTVQGRYVHCCGYGYAAIP